MSETNQGEVATRSRRSLPASKTSKFAAFEKLKNLRGLANKYELTEEAEVYQYVDEDEYSQIVQKRQEEDWIVDDGHGDYVEDGREIFDDDLGDQAQVYAKNQREYKEKNKKAKKVPMKRAKAPVDEEGSSSSNDDEAPVRKTPTIKTMFKRAQETNLKRKKDEKLLDDDEVLDNILSDLKGGTSSPGPSSSSFSSIRPMKLIKRKATPLSSSHANPFLVKSGSKLRSVADVRRSLNSQASYDLPVSPPSKRRATCGDFDSIVGKYNPSQDGFDDDDTFLSEIQEEKLKAPVIEKQLEAGFETKWESGSQNEVNANHSVPASNELQKHLEFFSEGNQSDKWLKFYWFDAHESPFVTPGTVYVFGKIFVKNIFVSCCCTVKNVEKRVYLLPRKTLKDDPSHEVTLQDVYKEFSEVVAKKHKISTFRSKKVTKMYAFDKKDVPLEAEYLEVLYPANFSLPSELEGNTFSHVFGTNQSSLEKLLVDLKLRGPGWLKVKNPELPSPPISWCKIELLLNKPNVQLFFDDEDKTPSPPMTLLSLTLRTYNNPHSRLNEIVAISCLIDRDFNLEKGASNKKQKFDSHFCAITKPSPASGIIFPFDFVPSKVAQMYKNTKVEVMSSEREMLNFFMAKFSQLDPDIIIGHDIRNFDLELLLSRLTHYKVGTWSKLGRLRKTGMPSTKSKDRGLASCGRLVADIKISAKELIKAKSYDMTQLVSQVLKKKRVEIERQGIAGFYAHSRLLFRFIDLTMMDNDFALSILLELNVLPLALQITKIAGNLLSRTLLGGRSERNEFLLLHAFHEKNYICPDKCYNAKNKGQSVSADSELIDLVGDELVVTQGAQKGKAGPARKKAAYTGGLVLEPKVGYYKDYVLILDFNSLYPTIMREYNICFTTIPIAEEAKENQENEEGEVIPALPDGSLESGVLPTQITKLVENRREVKKLLSNPNLAPDLKAQYDIKQKALKLTANSMYGCLGFGMSRFYAKPLASLITFKGREILLNTKQLVENLGFEVIYGDTDSIMINTKCQDFDEAMKISNKVQSSVNGMYKYLEIDCDGVLKSMLLLKKKKYAALVVSKANDKSLTYTKEMKGLDIVRRDWSVLAKIAGEKVLDEILSLDKSSEVIVDNVHTYLKELANSVRAYEVPVEQFIITKQLTKNPEDYPDKKNLCHVSVALKWNESNKAGKKLRGGDTVPYIICENVSNPDNFNALPATHRACHPDQMKDNQDLRVDVKYYLSQQIHPVVSRLCEPIDGTDNHIIAEFLGLESGYGGIRRENDLDDKAFLAAGQARFDACKSVLFKCPNGDCGKEIEVRTVFKENQEKEEKELPTKKYEPRLSKCSHCEFDLKPENVGQNLSNQLRLQIRRLVAEYYQGWMMCEDPVCGFRTRLSTGPMTKKGPKCPECNQSVLYLDVTEAQLHRQLSFFDYLFDLETAFKGLKIDDTKSELKLMVKQHEKVYKKLENTVTPFKRAMAYNELDLTRLFKRQIFKCVRGG